MDVSLLISGAMTLLNPYLLKAGQKAAETIGEKLAEKTIEKDFWQKAKRLFIVENEENIIEAIENKPVATSDEVKLIEDKFIKALNTDPSFAAEVQGAFNLSSVNIFVAEQLLKSLNADKERLEQLFIEKRDAGVETQGSYENMISITIRRMQKDEKEFIKLVTGK